MYFISQGKAGAPPPPPYPGNHWVLDQACLLKEFIAMQSRRDLSGRSKRVPPQEILKFQSPKDAIFSVLGTKFENKRACFSFKKM